MSAELLVWRLRKPYYTSSNGEERSYQLEGEDKEAIGKEVLHLRQSVTGEVYDTEAA
jgi:hypothetical protein